MVRRGGRCPTWCRVRDGGEPDVSFPQELFSALRPVFIAPQSTRLSRCFAFHGAAAFCFAFRGHEWRQLAHIGAQNPASRQPEIDPQLHEALGPQLLPVHRAAPQGRCHSLTRVFVRLCLASRLCSSACKALLPVSRIAPAVLRGNAALLLPAAAVAGATQSPTRAQPELSHTTQ